MVGGKAAIFLMQTEILTVMVEGGNKTMQKSKLVRLMRWWKSGTQLSRNVDDLFRSEGSQALTLSVTSQVQF